LINSIIRIFLTVAIILLVAAGLVLAGLSMGSRVNMGFVGSDYEALSSRTGISAKDLGAASKEDIISRSIKTTGKTVIDTYITSEEFTALMAYISKENGLIRDFSIWFEDEGEFEMSFRLVRDMPGLIKDTDIFAKNPGIRRMIWVASNKILSIDAKITRQGRNEVLIKAEKIKIGAISLGRAAEAGIEEELNRLINLYITQENGFMLLDLEITSGKLYYKGIIPAKIEGAVNE
jgi:hypothetical protein